MRIKDEKEKTRAFYVATHAASVHVILSLLAPENFNHWSKYDPSYGTILKWKVGKSTTVRMSPLDQVAGTAAVVDSVVVLKMLTGEGISPFLHYSSQVKPLLQAYRMIKQDGMACAVYGKWFLEGHPADIQPINFSQHDAQFADLVSELAIIGVKYYNGSTISHSATLQSLAKQSINEVVKMNWTYVANNKNKVVGSDFVEAVQLIKTGVTTDMLSNLISEDTDVYASISITSTNTLYLQFNNSLHLMNANEILPSIIRCQNFDRCFEEHR